MDRHAIYVHRHAKNNDFPVDFAIFTKALRTNGPTDRRTDTPSYRDAIAASKNGPEVGLEQERRQKYAVPEKLRETT